MGARCRCRAVHGWLVFDWPDNPVAPRSVRMSRPISAVRIRTPKSGGGNGSTCRTNRWLRAISGDYRSPNMGRELKIPRNDVRGCKRVSVGPDRWQPSTQRAGIRCRFTRKYPLTANRSNSPRDTVAKTGRAVTFDFPPVATVDCRGAGMGPGERQLSPSRVRR